MGYGEIVFLRLLRTFVCRDGRNCCECDKRGCGFDIEVEERKRVRKKMVELSVHFHM